MNDYTDYMNTITLSPQEHAALMAALAERQTARPAHRPRRTAPVRRYAALCACCALILAAAWGLPRLFSGQDSPLPGQVSPSDSGWLPPADPNAVVLDPNASPDPAIQDGPTDPNTTYPAVHLPQVLESAAPGQDIITLPIPSDAPAVITDDHVKVTVPQRDVETLTLEQARAAAELGGRLPAWVPGGFVFQEARRVPDQDQLSALWSRGYDDISVTVRRPAEPPATMDVDQTELYDVRLYSIPWADSVPQEVRDAGFDDPVFRAEDLTEAVIAARGLYVDSDAGDSAGYRCRFSVLQDDGLLVSYSLKGVTLEEVVKMLLGDN